MRVLLPFLLFVCVGGCITRPGMNASCEWPPEVPKPLDLLARTDERHLVVDTELAVELADRYSVQQHESPGSCEARLFRVIAETHSITPGEVASAGKRIADRGLDLPVNVTMGCLFLFATLRITRWVRGRFPDEILPATVTLILASVILSGIFIVLGDLWSSTLLMIRVGNHHVGGRAARLPWRQHTTELFTLGVVLFWLVTMVHAWLTGGRRWQTPGVQAE